MNESSYDILKKIIVKFKSLNIPFFNIPNNYNDVSLGLLNGSTTCYKKKKRRRKEKKGEEKKKSLTLLLEVNLIFFLQ